MSSSIAEFHQFCGGIDLFDLHDARKRIDGVQSGGGSFGFVLSAVDFAQRDFVFELPGGFVQLSELHHVHRQKELVAPRRDEVLQFAKILKVLTYYRI